jgi:cbb3-type cytochrome oxidase subunit 3
LFPMKPGNLKRTLKLLREFLFARATLLITLLLAAGLLFAFQEKRSLRKDEFNGGEVRRAEDGSGFTLSWRLPLYYYEGPLILTVQHPKSNEEMVVKVLVAGKEKTRGIVPPGSDFPFGFFLFPGSFGRAGEISLQVESEELPAEAPGAFVCTLEFPKAGFWLMPDLFLWFGLVLGGLLLGAAAMLIWSRRSPALACYLAIALLAILLVYLLGLQFAARLANLLPAVLLLFVVAATVRSYLKAE